MLMAAAAAAASTQSGGKLLLRQKAASQQSANSFRWRSLFLARRLFSTRLDSAPMLVYSAAASSMTDGWQLQYEFSVFDASQSSFPRTSGCSRELAVPAQAYELIPIVSFAAQSIPLRPAINLSGLPLSIKRRRRGRRRCRCRRCTGAPAGQQLIDQPPSVRRDSSSSDRFIQSALIKFCR